MRRFAHETFRASLAVPLAASLAVLSACRTSGDFDLIYEPDPVPREARTGHAWFRVRVDSGSREAVRIGEHGPWLPPGRAAWIDADLAAGEEAYRIEFFGHDGRSRAVLNEPIRTVPTDVRDEARIPMPRIAGLVPEVVAGFHASNHREPSRRLALDLVAPAGTPTEGAPVSSPVSGRVLAVTDDAPETPSERTNEILIRGDDGRILLFSHLRGGRALPWRPGDRVEVGAVLGHIGMSGHTEGPHLHVELVRDSKDRP
ncbi:MAG: M23 family metallopeptidase [Planctomycetes bacterium]|nr:M23 family metallopeptidase [Planctomycetota bacterium]